MCMKDSITQEMPYGCGIACSVFVAGISYQAAAKFFGEEQTRDDRSIAKHFRAELNRFGLKYTSRHIRQSETFEPIEGLLYLSDAPAASITGAGDNLLAAIILHPH